MNTPTPRRVRAVVIAALASGLFVFSWLLRFNDPGGSFAGLTDDHFFYLVRGWQILFGDLPVRDFVDHGAPLFYYIGAAVQTLFGRGTLSELAFTTTALSLSASLTFWLATRASGSIVAGLIAAALHILLGPRFYNYPKVLVYAVAIPLLWWFADRPHAWSRFALALVTVVAFLFRHDHGVFVAIAVAALLASLTTIPWRDRVRHAVLYAVLVCALLTPYLAFIEWNGGVISYFRQASDWAERDRERAPVIWPGLFDNPDGVSAAARDGSGLSRAIAVLRDNGLAWTYYLEILLPVFALLVLAVTRDGLRPEWPHARAKLEAVAVLAAVLDAGFLRSPLEARLADPSVPIVILVAWLLVALPKLLLSADGLDTRVQPYARAVRAAIVSVGIAIVLVLGTVWSKNLHRRVDTAAMTGGIEKAFTRVGNIADQLRIDWDLQSWKSRPDRPDLITLSLYINECTAESDRVLVQGYIPQVLALARRGFAGGHADLRPGFFKTVEAQELTIARLRRQSVPIILLEADKPLENFHKSFPLVMAHIDEHYRLAATHVFNERFGTSLFVRRDMTPVRVWEPLGWPCMR
jgi:hypothetical protein